MNWLAIIVAILTIVAILLIALKPDVPAPFTGELTNYSSYIYILLIGGALVLLAFFLMKFLGEDTAAINLWGALGILIGIGFASIADIWVNGYTFFVAMVGEFVPAAGPNLINAAILAPILLAAYKAVQSRTGR
jgi:hypothetical protein